MDEFFLGVPLLFSSMVQKTNFFSCLNFGGALKAWSRVFGLVFQRVLIKLYKTLTNLLFIVCTSVACDVGPSVTTSSTNFFLPKPGFLEFIWIFSSKNHFKINLPHFESRSYQINSINSCSSRSSQEQQRHIPSPSKLLAMI